MIWSLIGYIKHFFYLNNITLILILHKGDKMLLSDFLIFKYFNHTALN